MSTYFCSDLHGEYDLFMRLLDTVRLSNADEVYILGDCIDKGKDSFRLVDFVRRNRKTFKVICGNHEQSFLNFYNDFMEECLDGTFDSVLMRLKKLYQNDTELNWEIIDYLDALPYYIEKRDFVCVHAGLRLDERGAIIPLREQNVNYFLYDRTFKEQSVLPTNDRTVLFGHTPCHYENGTGDFIKTLKRGKSSASSLTDYAKIRLDTGVAFTRKLGMLRAEDMREFYVVDQSY